MTVFLIISACVLALAALMALPTRQLLGPPLAYVALLCLSFNGSAGYPVLPINSTILVTWLCMTLVVMLATLLQPEAIRLQTRGTGYILVGGLAGMAIGLLGFTVSISLPTLYSIMIVATLAGIFFGFLIYTNTPDGVPVGLRSGNFFKYLLAKGFPTAITIMQIGVALVLAIALYNVTRL